MRIAACAFLAIGLAIAQQHDPPAGGAPGHDSKAEEHKASGGGHTPMPNEIWWKWANFAMLAGVLGYLISKSAGPYFRAKAEGISEGIAGASAMRAEAEARAAAIEKQISNLSSEVEKIRTSAQEEMAAEGARMRKETEQALAKLQAQAQAELASATKSARQELKTYSAELALKLAESKIAQRMDPELQKQLTDSFVSDLKNKAALN